MARDLAVGALLGASSATTAAVLLMRKYLREAGLPASHVSYTH